jgi:hypothetical protein
MLSFPPWGSSGQRCRSSSVTRWGSLRSTATVDRSPADGRVTRRFRSSARIPCSATARGSSSTDDGMLCKGLGQPRVLHELRLHRAAAAGPTAGLAPPAAQQAAAGWNPLTRAWWAACGRPRWPLSTTPRTCTACCSSRCSWTTFGARRRRATGRSPAPRFGCKGSGFGLSPIDRRRLQWEIERSEQAQARGRRRQVARPPQDDPAGPPDLARMPGSPDTAG